jgi:xanthine dehydrogenase accessory factor
MKLDILQRLNVARHKRQAAILITDTESGHMRLVVESDGYDADPLKEELRRRFASGASGLVAGAEVFLTVHLPPPRLVVIGAVHISQALAPMAKLAGFDMTIVDPRTAFATDDRFPDATLMAEWPEDVMPRLGLDPFTALAALSHDPKIDDGALAAALRSGCFYVGALGSRKTHARRLERLRAVGLDDAALARIHAPIGLAIGAQSPAEIAVAILAEVIGALRARGAAAKEAAA